MSSRTLFLPLCGLLLGSAFLCAQERPISMPDKDFEALMRCADGAGQAQIEACNAYLAAFPASSGVLPVLEILLTAYDRANDPKRLLETADRLLDLDRFNLRALAFETSIRIQAADNLTDMRAKRDEVARAARYARRGLEAEKPSTMSEAEWDVLRDATRPIFQAALSRARLWGVTEVLESPK